MAISNYPADPRKVPRFNVTNYFAVLLQETGFPTVTEADMARLKPLLENFIYQQPKEATR
jgi:hypothetical protein